MSRRGIKMIAKPMREARQNFMIKTIEKKDLSYQAIIRDIFNNYHNTGRDDKTIIKKVFSTIKAEDINTFPAIINELINYARSCIRCPAHYLIDVKCYLFTRCTKTIIDAPHQNTVARIFFNYNMDEDFFLDPQYEDITEDGKKVIISTGLDEHDIHMGNNSVFIMAPGTRYRHTIKDVKKRGKPRIGSYQRLNITVDIKVPDEIMRRLREIEKHTTQALKISSDTSKLNVEKLMEKMKSDPKNIAFDKQIREIMESKETSSLDDSSKEVLAEMARVKSAEISSPPMELVEPILSIPSIVEVKSEISDIPVVGEIEDLNVSDEELDIPTIIQYDEHDESIEDLDILKEMQKVKVDS